ncbi:MAG: sulfatase [Opitutales bacterium]|nr:sulfatase [Opitutales bacterium]
MNLLGNYPWTTLAAGKCLLACAVVAASDAPRPNVLLISVDDFKPQTAAYGHEIMHTPNLDRLAAEGVLFERAYCQQAICAPSRASLLTGMRPDSTGVIDLFTHFRDINPDAVTLPQLFAENGYGTWGTGKIFHASRPGDPDDQSYSWNEGYSPAGMDMWVKEETLAAIEKKRERARAEGLTGLDFYLATRGPSTERAEAPEEAYPDGDMTLRLIGKLEEKAASGEPFFYTIGYLLPHLPFSAPAKYWDLYDRDELELPPTSELPEGAPRFAFQDSWELRNYPDIPPRGEPIPETKGLELIHGYYASVSFIDALIGRVLDTLEATGLAENTVVLLFGDHGYHLGDHGMWCKHTNFEQANHSALMLRYPGNPEGRRVARPVELLDIYPTLAAFAGLEPPADQIEGRNLVPVIEDPGAEWKPFALSQYPRHIDDDPRGMGYSLRTQRYRYTEWVVNPDWPEGMHYHPWPGNRVVARELYDYETDPHEKRNLAGDPDYTGVEGILSALMRAGPPDRRPARMTAETSGGSDD